MACGVASACDATSCYSSVPDVILSLYLQVVIESQLAIEAETTQSSHVTSEPVAADDIICTRYCWNSAAQQ
jgi:hypothetical protein